MVGADLCGLAFCGGDEHPRLAVFEHIFVVALVKHRVDGHGPRAVLYAPQEGVKECGRIGKEDHHPLRRLHAQRLENVREPVTFS